LISASEEWRAFTPHFPLARIESTPYGDFFTEEINGYPVVFLHGSWGKIAAAGSTQYAILRWRPERIVNIGTCGGFQGQVEHGQVILAAKTIIYDIIEQMGDHDDAIRHYTVDFDLTWLPSPTPQPVTAGTIVSADRDIVSADIPDLIQRYNAAVGDWESGPIAWVARRNQVPCLILRAVSDLVGEHGSEAYQNDDYFPQQCLPIMAEFVRHLPAWLDAFRSASRG
jgi:adenosylhomocysteine nucleosidase